MAAPATQYARSGDLHIAYEVVGSGAFDLVFVPGILSNMGTTQTACDVRLGAAIPG